MIIEFTVGNYRSFKGRTTFSMVAANLSSKVKILDQQNVTSLEKSIKLVRTAAIYGANASGKSNFIKAITFMRQFIQNSSKETQSSEKIPVENFKLSTVTENAPSYFEIVFTAGEVIYRYGFEADTNKVHSEWLYRTSVRETNLFERNLQTIEPKNQFKEGKSLETKTRENALFLSVCAQFNGAISKEVVECIHDIRVINGIDDMNYRPYTIKQLEGVETKISILQMLNKFDFGIADISAESSPVKEGSLPPNMPEPLVKYLLDNGTTTVVNTFHKKYDNENNNIGNAVFNLDLNESEGTQKAFSMCGPLLDVLNNGKCLIIDELDARLHPIITKQIINLFHDPSINKNNGQLIFATHDTNLLDNKFFRRDQIWFAEKNIFGETAMYSLVDYKIRNDASFEKDYIAGKYGAIPFLGNFTQVEVADDAQ